MHTTFKISTLALAAMLAACGGGGGSPGVTEESYGITLRAEKTQLPLNIAGNPVGQGVYAPYTTTLYVEASAGGRPIPGGKDIFGCNVAGGLDTGSLYYLDGDPEHEQEIDDGNGGKIKVPTAYRSITLGSNSGGNSFHFHAKSQAGTARITCTVTDPRDKQQKSASVEIMVGAATGKAASIQTIAQYPFLGSQGNMNNLRTSTAIEAFVLDDANQPLPAAAKANLQVAIASGQGANGARLLAGEQSGSVLQVKTIGGVGLFSLSSGSKEGPILLELKSDRFDNDVTNGIQEPVVALLVVTASTGNAAGVAPDPLVLVDVKPPAATNGLPYSYAFSAKGGVGPYTWAALGGLPEGLSLSASGVLSGTPFMKVPGTVQVAVRVTDSRGVITTTNVPLVVSATTASDPATSPLSINLSGCGSDLNTACALPDAPKGGSYQYVLTATGAGSGNVTWNLEGATSPIFAAHPSFSLSLTSSGILQGASVPPTCDLVSEPFFIKATKGGSTAIRKVTIKIGSGPGGSC